MTDFMMVVFLGWMHFTTPPGEPGRPQDAPASPDIPAFVHQLDSLRKAADIPGLSVAKPLSAVVALRLSEEGVLDLDRPMVRYSDWGQFCTEFSEQPSIFARDLRCRESTHTLRHLLSHTATATPGTRFSYNPVLYSWASRPIMAVAGASFSALVEQYVFSPAGMMRSARKHRELPLRDDLAAWLAPPHRIDGSGAIERAPVSPPQGDGAARGVVSTVLDLAKFDIALDQGRLISAESRAVMMAPAGSSNGEVVPYGVGWFVEEYEGHTLVWHSGWWEDAYSALYLKIPERQLTFIVLGNMRTCALSAHPAPHPFNLRASREASPRFPRPHVRYPHHPCLFPPPWADAPNACLFAF